MFRAISLLRAHLRSLPQTLISLPQSSSSSSFSNSKALHILSNAPIDSSSSLTLNPTLPSIPIPSSAFSYSPSRHKHEKVHVEDSLWKDPTSPPKLFVVQPRLKPEARLHAKLGEALNLANSLEEQRDGYFDTEFGEKEPPPHVLVQNPLAKFHRPHAATFFGHGTLENVKCLLDALEQQVDAVFVNTKLSGVQQRNLEMVWGKPVLDRVGLIIEIFNAHAYTKEAKLQAELAALTYKKSRLVRIRALDGRYAFGASGESEVVSARGRGSGGRGFISGAGETELELQRRRIIERRRRLFSLIEEVHCTRAVQRVARKRDGASHGENLATVAVVGYTNAGKSTLVSALSDTYMYCDDRLFATVDPRLRGVILPSGRKVLVSDTVGFISDLPVQLVQAFHATLEEVVEADLLVHVIDSSAPDLNDQRETVLQVLKQIGVSEVKIQDMIEVWNKIDLQNEMGTVENLVDGENDESGRFSEAEDSQAEVDLSSGETFDDRNHEDNDDVVSDSWEAVEEQGDYSDGSLSPGDNLESVEEKWASSVDCNTLDGQQSTSAEDGIMMVRHSDSQLESVPHVKTSATMGVGLLELVQLIDEKLGKELTNETVLERGALDKKWRQPRIDVGMAVE